jgi:hypothetical protein
VWRRFGSDSNGRCWTTGGGASEEEAETKGSNELHEDDALLDLEANGDESKLNALNRSAASSHLVAGAGLPDTWHGITAPVSFRKCTMDGGSWMNWATSGSSGKSVGNENKDVISLESDFDKL